jgi:hypothetical protein
VDQEVPPAARSSINHDEYVHDPVVVFETAISIASVEHGAIWKAGFLLSEIAMCFLLSLGR